MKQIRSTFTVANWNEEEVWSIGDLTAKKAAVTYDYQGDLTGKGKAEFLLVYRPDGKASFTAVEVFEGQYNGESCTAVFRHTGEHSDAAIGDLRLDYATGALEGFKGQASYWAASSTVDLLIEEI